jgi:hypothetical protein
LKSRIRANFFTDWPADRKQRRVVAKIVGKSLARILAVHALWNKRPVFPSQDKVTVMQQLSAENSIPCRLATMAFFFGVIAILGYSDILLDGLATTAGNGLHRLTQELWMFCR